MIATVFVSVPVVSEQLPGYLYSVVNSEEVSLTTLLKLIASSVTTDNNNTIEHLAHP